MRESQLQKLCIQWARRAYRDRILVVNVPGTGWANKGFPDLLCLSGGRCLAVELKNGDAYQLQPDQQIWRDRIRRCGCSWALCKSLGEFQEIVRKEFGS